MPNDSVVALPIGANGLNLRTNPTELGMADLVDVLNWQLDRDGVLLKRRGYQAWAITTPSAILETMLLALSNGTNYVLAHCADGHVYSTTDGSVWTSIDSGISSTTPVGWVQYQDAIYYNDGTASMRKWDGTTLTTTASAPKGRLMTVWRNRLWIALARTVYWSNINAPTDFTTYPLNTVVFPSDTNITALTAGPNVGSGASGSDGVIVFTRGRVHRIYDDTDNVAGAILGGANSLVDAAIGCVSQATVAIAAGDVWFLSEQGVYSTDGHSVFDEMVWTNPLLRQFSWGSVDNFCAFSLNDRYYLGYRPIGESTNTRLLEAYSDYPRTGRTRFFKGQHQWMAHDVPVAAAVTVTDSLGQTTYFADASNGDTAYVRKLFVGGYDTDGAGTKLDIACKARTGALLFGVSTPKRLRRVQIYGQGNLTLSVSPDLQSGAGESRSFDMRNILRDWDTSDTWGTGVWGGGGGAITKPGYYTIRGRYLTFELVERSQDVTTSDRVLGYAGAESGGAAVYSVVLKITPLDAD